MRIEIVLWTAGALGVAVLGALTVLAFGISRARPQRPTARIRTTRQARIIRQGIGWGRVIVMARDISEDERQRVTERAEEYARSRRSNLMAVAIHRTAYSWMSPRVTREAV